MVITIDVRPLTEQPKDACDIVVEARGYIEEAITYKTREMFQISKKAIRELRQKENRPTGNSSYAKCSSLFTLLSDPFSKCNWDKVTTSLHPVKTEITEMYTETVDAGSKTLLNSSNKTGTFHADLSYEDKNTITKSSNIQKEINLGLKMGYKVLLPASATISFQSLLGEDTQLSEAVTVESRSCVEVELKPGEEMVANQSVTRYIIEVKVTYEVGLRGYVGCEFVDRFKWLRKRYHVNDLLETANLQTTVTASEVLKICFYSNGRIDLSNRQGNGL